MAPTFWKLSMGGKDFKIEDIRLAIQTGLVYMHKDTAAKGQSSTSQGQHFIDAMTGDYFYLTYKNEGIRLLGQFSGPVNFFSHYGEGWLDRPFRTILLPILSEKYTGPVKWWTPNHNSTFVQIPDDSLNEFDIEILRPFFGVSLKDFGLLE